MTTIRAHHDRSSGRVVHVADLIRQGAAPPSGHAEASGASHTGSVNPPPGPNSQRPSVSLIAAISAPLAS